VNVNCEKCILTPELCERLKKVYLSYHREARDFVTDCPIFLALWLIAKKY